MEEESKQSTNLDLVALKSETIREVSTEGLEFETMSSFYSYASELHNRRSRVLSSIKHTNPSWFEKGLCDNFYCSSLQCRHIGGY